MARVITPLQGSLITDVHQEKLVTSSNKLMSSQKLEMFGSIPTPRFGHTTTVLSKTKVIMYGGATGNTGQFFITDNTYLLEMPARFWKKIEVTGITPSPRAAHAAAAITNNSMLMFGGATGTGGLASDEVFRLELKNDGAVWETLQVVGKGPGKRYGHIMCYVNNFIIVFGGNTGDKSIGDCWLLNLQKKTPLSWLEIKSTPQKSPGARVYHSAAVCPIGAAKGMIVVFGGRGMDGSALSDSWGLRRHTEGTWDWIKAPYQGCQPSARYQHSVLFIGSIMLVVGGRATVVNQNLSLDAYDTVTSNWYKFNSPQRFRSGTFLIDTMLHIYGGFELATPNIPTDSLIRLNLMNIFATKPALKDKISSFQSKTGQTPSNSKPSTPTMQDRGSAIISSGTQKTPRSQQQQRSLKQISDPRKVLTSKEDLALMFLNVLCQPQQHFNTEAIKFNFKPFQIISLVEMAREIVMQQPILVRVKAPVKIFGDIHGQLSDLLNFFRMFGSPFLNGKKNDVENFDYIFLGDFIDRGSQSLETICLLMALKVLCPKNVHLIRGNHEDIQTNSQFGFMEECAEKCNQDTSDHNSVYNYMNRFFEWLPLAAVVEERILCLHGGIGSSVKTLDDILKIKRPVNISHQVSTLQQQVILDILWSDPTESDDLNGILPNQMRDPHQTGNIVKFGPDIVHEFLRKTNLSLIVRAHECVMDGFERFAGGALITVFSATDYCRRHKNAGAILIVKTNLQIVPKLIYPSNNNYKNWKDDDDDLKRRPPTPPRWRASNART